MTDVKKLLESYSFYGKEEELGYEATQKLIIKEVDMPSFYTFDEPTPNYVITIEPANGSHIFTVADEEGTAFGGTFGDIENAYDFVQGDLKGNVIFAGDVKAFSGEDDPHWLSVASDKPGFSRMLLATTDDLHVGVAKYAYLKFLESTLRYEANPSDFFTAYYWLDHHPAFYTRYKEDGNSWKTDNNDSIRLDLFKNESGQVTFSMEYGSSVPDARMEHYHDMRLDVYEKTYNDAIIALAARVHKFFDVDGSERPDVEYEKSELEILLEERMDEATEAYKKDNTDDADSDETVA